MRRTHPKPLLQSLAATTNRRDAADVPVHTIFLDCALLFRSARRKPIPYSSVDFSVSVVQLKLLPHWLRTHTSGTRKLSQVRSPPAIHVFTARPPGFIASLSPEYASIPGTLLSSRSAIFMTLQPLDLRPTLREFRWPGRFRAHIYWYLIKLECESVTMVTYGPL